MLRSLCFCFALVSASVAFGQQRVQLPDGRTGTFVADGGGQIAPTVDPAFQAPVVVQQRQHAGNCGCEVCARRVLSQETRERSKTIREITTVTVIEETHPLRTIKSPPPTAPQNPCPPQDPCAQPQRQGGGLPAWNQGAPTYAQWCEQQRQRQQQSWGFFPSWGGRPPLVAVNAGVSFAGFGPQLNGSIGNQPPHAQAGHNYSGNYTWHGGR